MIIIDCEQGDLIWRASRIGIPTASQFDRIVTEKRCDLSTQSKAYMYELCHEYFTGQPHETKATKFMERGTGLEDEARNAYAFENNVGVRQIGFALRDDRKVGCSPDSLVGTNRGLEIKILSGPNHLRALEEGVDSTEYRCQVQGCMWIMELEAWDRYYWNPIYPAICDPIPRDDVFIAKLSSAVDMFIEQYEEMKQRFIERDGLVHVPPKVSRIDELEAARKARDEREAKIAENVAEFDRAMGL